MSKDLSKTPKYSTLTPKKVDAENGGLDISNIWVYTPNYGKGNRPTRYGSTQAARGSMHLHAYSQSGACDYTILRYDFAAAWLADDPGHRAGGGRAVRTGKRCGS